ncbi:hypothetical protein FD754_014529 [Muntiacus muntjak]|uniref:Complement C3/4/5 macroglobulin domain-containing protein n=1 Tax=Muntiacus muntjak TaxID=9888 RepID=A0A5N3VKG8_MUNMU|nr:hypothetical protein FD754_014529 [Muntiacus muntjak]
MDILSIVYFFLLGKKYVVSAPDVVYVGTSENVIIQIHGDTKSFPVTIAVKINLSPENKFQSSASLTKGQKLLRPEKNFLLELSVFLTSRFHLILSILNGLLVQLFLLRAVTVTGLLNSLMEPSTCG